MRAGRLGILAPALMLGPGPATGLLAQGAGDPPSGNWALVITSHRGAGYLDTTRLSWSGQGTSRLLSAWTLTDPAEPYISPFSPRPVARIIARYDFDCVLYRQRRIDAQFIGVDDEQLASFSFPPLLAHWQPVEPASELEAQLEAACGYAETGTSVRTLRPRDGVPSRWHRVHESGQGTIYLDAKRTRKATRVRGSQVTSTWTIEMRKDGSQVLVQHEVDCATEAQGFRHREMFSVAYDARGFREGSNGHTAWKQSEPRGWLHLAFRFACAVRDAKS